MSTPLNSAARSIRVFISSTFQDMQEEREELVKRIFPRLRKLCEQRGIGWSEVDLRWGVTDEAKAEGGVLPTCFAEIDKCRPLFIGFLGHRFGWVPEEIPAALVEQEPWLKNHLGSSSVTELEFLHGVLNDPVNVRGRFFYFRSRAFIDALPPERRALFEEVPLPSDIERLGRTEAERICAERRRKLEALKQRIRQSGLPLRDNYPDAVAVGEMVYTDLLGVIDALYPEGETIDPLDREAAEHAAFATDRVRFYVGGGSYIGRMDAHVAQQSALNNERGLVITGLPGAGKSALLANWALRHAAGRPTKSQHQPVSLWQKLMARLRPVPMQPVPPLVVTHFVGATVGSADPDAMLRRLIAELNRHLDLRQNIPETTEALRVAFANCLHRAATNRRIVIVIDALNELSGPDQLPLAWLPQQLPDNIRLIVSTLDGPELRELEGRHWPRLDLQPLQREDRRELITDFLALYRKALDPDRVARIAQVEQAGNPLFLRVLLDELRLHGDHWTLDECIDRYLNASSLDDLFERVLERYQRDFERGRPGLVAEAMALLWSARRGLSEDELLDLLGSDGERLPRALWSPLGLAIETFVYNRSGLISLSHDYVRRTLQRRFLSKAAERNAVHLRLAHYFGAQGLGERVFEELPWQLARAEAWPALRDRLADVEFFTRAWSHDRFDVKRHWAELEARTEYRAADAYADIISSPERAIEQHGIGLAEVARLLFDMGAVESAQSIGDALWRHYRKMVVPRDAVGQSAEQVLRVAMGREPLSPGLIMPSGDMMTNGDVVEAMLEIINSEIGSVHSLEGQISVLIAQGRYEDALMRISDLEGIYLRHSDKAGQAKCLANRGLVLSQRGKLDDALPLLRQSELDARVLGEKALVAEVLGYQGHLMSRRREHEQALALFQKQEAICRELGMQEELTDCLSNQAILFKERGELEQALRIFEEAEVRAREWGNARKVIRALGNRATVLVERGDYDAAWALFEEAANMARQINDKRALHTTLGNQATILSHRGLTDDAVKALNEKEALCRELDDKRGLADALEKSTGVYFQRRDFETALGRAAEALALSQELGDWRGVAQLQLARAEISTSLGRIDDALSQVEEAYYTSIGGGLTNLLGDIERLRTRLNAERSIHSWRDKIALAPDDPEIRNDLAIALYQAGQVDGAIAELDEVIRRHPGSPLGYFGKGMIYEHAGQLQTALEQFRLAHGAEPTSMTIEACNRVDRALASSA